MNFNKVLNDNSLIDDINDKDLLDKLYKEGTDLIHPTQKVMSFILQRKNEVKKQEYLASRGMNNFPILNELLDELGQEYKEILIDIDEELGNKHLIRFYDGKIVKNLGNYKIGRNYIEKYEIKDKIINFLIDNKIISPIYKYICPLCGEETLIFDGKFPTEEELEKKIDSYGVCYSCDEYLETDLDYVKRTVFYNILNRK